MGKRYSTIVFDLGNVLIPFDHSLWVKNFNEIETGLGDNYYKMYLDNYEVHRDYERGDISDEEFIKINCNWLNNKVSNQKFCEIFSNMFTLNNNVIELLPVLKKNYRLVLLSNTNQIHKKYGWQHYPFLQHFEKLILSHEVGAVKPEKEIYKAVENYTNEIPQSHIFIDDILEYVNGAKKNDWDSIHFVGYENLIKELNSRNIL